MGFPKPRMNGKSTRAHSGQAKSAPRKRANQAERRERLAQKARELGITVEQLQARQARAKPSIIAEGRNSLAAPNHFRSSDPYWR